MTSSALNNYWLNFLFTLTKMASSGESRMPFIIKFAYTDLTKFWPQRLCLGIMVLRHHDLLCTYKVLFGKLEMDHTHMFLMRSQSATRGNCSLSTVIRMSINIFSVSML